MTLTLNPAETEADTADTAAPEQPQAEGRIAVTAQLQPRHHEYLAERAALHGETPERHLETILRTFRAHHDGDRPTFGGSQRRV